MAHDLEGKLLSGFQLHSLIGEGAHGSVWRARQLRLDREVAVKILDPVVARNPDTVRRFEREGRAAASIDHPNVVPVYEAGEAEGLAFLAMRLVEGVTLDEHINAVGPLTMVDAAELLSPIAAALDFVHASGLVHRDVKPSNILIEDERIWLADFGIAASLRELGNYTTGALGTAEYMAPEQANAADVDHRADIYSLGCVAHFVMEGLPPFEGDDLIATLMAHQNDRIPTTGEADRDQFYGRALAKDPDVRFTSAGELIAALAAESASPAPIAAGSPRRIRLLAAAAAIAVLAVVALVAALTGDDDPGVADADTVDNVTPSSEPAGTDPPATSGETDHSDVEDVETTVPAPPGLLTGGNIDVATGRRLVSLNPHADLEIEPFITGNVLPPLMTVNDDWTLSPWLAADEPEIRSADPLVVRWQLRPDAVWDDGTPITSTDVSRTLDYITTPDAEVASTGLYDGVTLEIVDAQTFDLTFAEPAGAYRLLFSTLHPVIKAAAYDQHLAEGKPASTFMVDSIPFSGGPFTVAGYDAGERLTLVRSESWWGDAAHLERITIRNFDSARGQLDAVETGDVDLAYIELATTSDVAKAREFENTQITVGTGHLFVRLDMNTRTNETAELAVRTAIATALDRFLIAGAVVTPVTGAAAAPLDSAVWPSNHPANAGPFAEFDGDIATAAEMLQSAGWALDTSQDARFKDGQVLELQLLYESEASILGQTLAGSVVNQLRDAGMRVIADGVPRSQIDQRRVSGDYDMVAVVTVASPDPVSAQLIWGSEYCPVQFGQPGCESALPGNLTGIADIALDNLLAAATAETDPTVREQLYVDIDARLAELVPTIPLAEMPVFVAYSDALGGVAIETQRSGPFGGMDGWGFLAP